MVPLVSLTTNPLSVFDMIITCQTLYMLVGGKTPDVSAQARTYTAVMQEQVLRKAQVRVFILFRQT